MLGRTSCSSPLGCLNQSLSLRSVANLGRTALHPKARPCVGGTRHMVGLGAKPYLHPARCRAGIESLCDFSHQRFVFDPSGPCDIILERTLLAPTFYVSSAECCPRRQSSRCGWSGNDVGSQARSKPPDISIEGPIQEEGLIHEFGFILYTLLLEPDPHASEARQASLCPKNRCPICLEAFELWRRTRQEVSKICLSCIPYGVVVMLIHGRTVYLIDITVSIGGHVYA